MQYCCEKFEIKAEAPDGFYQRPDGTWGIWFCFIHLECCPFCGKGLESRFEVQSHGDGWVVFENGERGAYFHTEEEAEEHVLFLTRREDQEHRS